MEPSSQARRQVFRRGRWILALVAPIVVATACSSSAPPSSLGHAELGPNPFLSVELAPTPAELQPLFSEAVDEADNAEQSLADDQELIDRARARATAATDPFEAEGIGLIRPRSAASVAIVPGDPDEVCSIDAIIAGFAADADAAEAFASVHGLAPEGIPEYLGSLRAGYLVDDLSVINHRFRGGSAEPYATVLSAGTAVLTDDDGIPRVRCHCGNPLLPASVELNGQLIDASAFADRVVEASVGDDVPDRVDDSVDGTFTNDRQQALGPPDRIALSLGDDPEAANGGCRFSITIEFVDNRLVDGPGDDLQVIELGRPESSFVFIGNDAAELRLVGEIGGGDSTIDIAAVAEPDETFALVRLCDGPDQVSEVPGTDIDAVVALNSDPR